jgi:hypothetical protein
VSEFSPESQQFLLTTANSTAPLIDPDSDRFLKKTAGVAAVVFRNVGITIDCGLALSEPGQHLDVALCAFDVGVLDLDFAEREELLANGVITVLEAGADIAGGHPIRAGLAVNSFIWGSWFASELQTFAEDPPDSNFDSIVSFSVPSFEGLIDTGDPELDTLFSELFDATSRTYLSLGAVNVSFDRYAAALAAGDPVSTGLQLEAILHFLSLYNTASQDASGGLSRSQDLLLEEGIPDIVFDAAAFRELQEEIAANGFPSQVTDFYDGIGLTPAEIDLLRSNFVNQDPSKFGTLSGSISRLAAALTGPPHLPVAVDIRPRGCRNPLNTKAMGVLPVAVLGAADFDVAEIDPDSVRLEGVAALGSDYGDVATPFLPYLDKSDALDCTADGSDGFTDLKLNFRNQDISARLGPLTPGEVRVLNLTGELHDGTPIIGEDVVVVLR